MEEIQNEGETNLYTRHQKEFPHWFLERASAFILVTLICTSIIRNLQISYLVQVMHLSVDESTARITEIIDLVKGPQKTVSRMTACTINGHRFHTKDRETRRKSQNSGVVVQGDHQGEIIDF